MHSNDTRIPGRTLAVISPDLQTIEPIFRKATQLWHNGRVNEADRLYRDILTIEPDHFDTLHHLGVIRAQQNRLDEAVELLRKAIQQEPRSADAHVNLAVAYEIAGRADEAIAQCDTALAIRPSCAEAHFTAGNALKFLERLQEAIVRYQQAIAIQPRYAEAYYNLGNTFSALERHREALEQYGRALAIEPRYTEALNNRGAALQALQRHEEALEDFDRALAISPNDLDALSNRGNALVELKHYGEALAIFDKVLSRKADYPDAWYRRGIALQALRRYPEAVANYDKALTIRPDHVDALNNRADVLLDLKRPVEALASFETALSIQPGHSYALVGAARVAAGICDWARSAKFSQELIRHVAEGRPVLPLPFLSYCGEPELQLACAKTFIASQVPAPLPPLRGATIRRNKKIRIAYLSVGFHQHPTAYLTAGLFELHDRSSFEIIGISLGPDDGSDIRARLVRAFDEFHDVRAKSDREAAALIHDLQVDILVDRSGYTADARPAILAHRPAPVQVSYIGYPGTLGADFYDYVIADPIVLPMDQQPFFTERIVHLPDCYLVNDSKRAITAEIPTRREAGLPDQGIVFCCFNNTSKIQAPMFDIWMRLLQRVDASVLWLLRSHAAAEANLRKEAVARGINPARLVFADWQNPERHLARQQLADLFLDTLPYNAHTTAIDALWTGLPLVTCPGQAFASRVAASTLHAVGFPELVTNSLDDYEALALKLATDASLLRELRIRLRQNRLTCPLFDADRYRRHIESAYRTMWEICQRGEDPRSFRVDTLPADA